MGQGRQVILSGGRHGGAHHIASGDAAAQDTAEPLPDIDSQPIEPGARSNGRFIPSEQISQDLGVSFPVDI